MPRGRPAEPGLSGILLVDKPAGWTSHDVVAKVRRLAGQRQVGHTGTLDPMATGLLVLCLGRATRLVEYMVGHDKSYSGVVQLGASTTTDDAEGEVVERTAVPPLSFEDLERVARQFQGPLQQVPPAFSAVKIEGQRAYAVARKGGNVTLAPRPVTVYTLKLEFEAPDRLRLDVTCSAGTYVRSLARDIGRALGTRAHLASLRRLRVGPFQVDDAYPLEALMQSGPEDFPRFLLPIDEGVADLGAAIVTEERAVRVAHGERIRAAATRPEDALRLYTTGGQFVGIAAIDSTNVVRPVKVLMS
jgi:tRNA pseudouridine55 synthase